MLLELFDSLQTEHLESVFDALLLEAILLIMS